MTLKGTIGTGRFPSGSSISNLEDHPLTDGPPRNPILAFPSLEIFT
jgi:hypothetical protein